MPLNTLEIDFWDVGQGNCSVIKLDDGSRIIIDVGRRGSPLADWLSDRPVYPRIRAIILTHNDADHAGALPGILDRGKHLIEGLYALVDRDITAPAFQKILEAAKVGERNGFFQLERLERGKVIWQDDALKMRLIVVQPTMLQNVEAADPNDTSGIICLEVDGKVEIIWPGDTPMKKLNEACYDSEPFALTGTHHGAPTDYRTPDSRDAIQAIRSKNNYISVGTHNSYSHPRPRFIRQLEGQGCRVRCSQLTYRCERIRVLNRQHVLKTHAYLGLRAPRGKYVACRGPWRLSFIKGQFVPDRWDNAHLEIISTLKRPQCLLGRGWKKGNAPFI